MLLFNPKLPGIGVHAFPRSSNSKVNVITCLGFELAYFDVTVRHVNHYVTGTLLLYTVQKCICTVILNS